MSNEIKPPQLLEGYKKNFNTLREAFGQGDVALLSAIRISDNKPVALVVAVCRRGGEVEMTPFAVMCEGNPFEDFIPAN